MNRDFVEMLSALAAADAEYLIVGAHAMAAHGVPRATGDLDIWIRPSATNATRVHRALGQFGAPLHDLTLQDLGRPDIVFQIGLPPARIDILTSISGVSFEDAWPRRLTVRIGELQVPVLGRDDFLRNKRAVGRPKDIADIALLEEQAG